MKGTFFSADFVIDKNDNLRLIEINTDTGIVSQQKSILDWTDFIQLLSGNSITELEVIYKNSPQTPIVESLSDVIYKDATFITNYIKTIVPEDSIFPPSPTDSINKFILRMAYDEFAILDSEFAKGTLSLLELFADNDDEDSVIGFYHGSYNTISKELSNPGNIPDIICKTTIELQQPHNFYKIGNPDNKTDSERINDFIEENKDTDIILEEYHFYPLGSQENNKVYSQRTFQIVYGTNLDLCYVSEYDIPAIFEIPETIEYDETILSNRIESKHYYEFATNHIKNFRHGFLDDVKIETVNDGPILIDEITIGTLCPSFYIVGAPDTDDDEIIRNWRYPGNKLPEGSYETTSTLNSKFSMETYANDMTTITFEDQNSIVVGGETRILVYDEVYNNLLYQRVLDLTPNYEILVNSGNNLKIYSVDTTIYDEPQTVFALNLEPVDNFVLSANNVFGISMPAYYIVHNACFPAGTKIKTKNNDVLLIEDIKIGDEILSYNEENKEYEIKKVTLLRKPIHTDLIKYRFENGESLITTQDHPIYIKGFELSSFRPDLTTERYNLNRIVNKIKIGDEIYFENVEQTTSITNIEVLENIDPIQTYLITVKDNHNFFANNVLVHNK